MSKMLIAFCGPSCSGKSTLLNDLSSAAFVERVVTTTTRKRRPGEITGIDYHFVDQRCFGALAASGSFLEWTAFDSCLYGITKHALEHSTTLRRVSGVVCTPHALQKLARWCEPRKIRLFSVFVDSDKESLRQRLKQREVETGIDQQARFNAINEHARNWRQMWPYDFTLKNKDARASVDELASLVQR